LSQQNPSVRQIKTLISCLKSATEEYCNSCAMYKYKQELFANLKLYTSIFSKV